MYKYESMAMIIRDYLASTNKSVVLLTALEARKLDGMDEYASNSCYENVARAMECVSERYFRGTLINEGQRGSSTFTYEYILKW